MKTQLTSVDVYMQVNELNGALCSARIDKAYQIAEKELKIRVHIRGEGSRDLIIAPNFICVSGYKRAAPETPSSFAMQLRKHLKGAFIREVRQRGFERIIEFYIEKKDCRYRLICELFSRGNVILCDDKGKILGLMEWQRWKHRKLGVGQEYSYPPGRINPLEISQPEFRGILEASAKSTVAALATDLGLGGTYAEEVCLRAEVDKDKNFTGLNDDEIKRLYNVFLDLTTTVKNHEIKPRIILADEKSIDVTPFPLRIYEGMKLKEFESFNLAIDEYFSEKESISVRRDAESRFNQKMGKIRLIEQEQTKTIEELEGVAVECKDIGDLIYQNMNDVEEILKTVKKLRDRDYGWEDIDRELSGKRFNKLVVESVNKDSSINLKTAGDEG